MSAVMDREIDVTAEWNHSCTSQCPNPCPASSRVVVPETEAWVSPDC